MKRTALIVTVLAGIFSCQSSDTTNENLRQTVAEVNRRCPAMVDSETRLDGVYVSGSDTLVYKYALVNIEAMSVDTSGFRKAMWPGLLSNVRVSPEMQSLRDGKVHIQYRYDDRRGKPIYTFRIRPSDYK